MGRFPKLILVGVTVIAIAVRFQVRWILDPIRRFNRRFYNRFILVFAGERGMPYAVVRHVGRRSGQHYETPVAAAAFPGGFVVSLPYGANVDWLRNLQAAGGGKLFYEGDARPVGAPELIDETAAFALLPEGWRQFCEVFGVKQFVRLREQSVVSSAAKDFSGLAQV